MGLSVVRFELEGTPSWGVLENGGVHRINQSFQHQRDLLNAYFEDPSLFRGLIDQQPLTEDVQ